MLISDACFVELASTRCIYTWRTRRSVLQSANFVMFFGFRCSQGRLVRTEDSEGDYFVLVSMKSFLDTRLLIDTHNEEEKEEVPYGAGTLMNEQQNGQTAESESTPESDPLSENERKSWRDLRRSMFMDVVRLLCLNLGCLQRRLELFLSSGVLDRLPDIGDGEGDDTNCGQSCPVCCGKGRQWDKIN